jgi:hypothetical protein
MDDDEKFVVTSNIRRFRSLLQTALAARERRTVETLLAAAELEFSAAEAAGLVAKTEPAGATSDGARQQPRP